MEPAGPVVARFDVRAVDAAGDEGVFSAEFVLIMVGRAALAAELVAPDGAELFAINEEYSRWPKYRDVCSQTIGYRSDGSIEGVRLNVYEFPDGSLFHLAVLRQRPSRRGAAPFGQLDWIGGQEARFTLRGFDPLTHRFQDLRSAWEDLRFLAKIRLNRGKRPGDGSAYPSDAMFLAALDDAIRAVQKSTGRKVADARSVMRRLDLRHSAFYETVRRTTGRRWSEVARNYAEFGGLEVP